MEGERVDLLLLSSAVLLLLGWKHYEEQRIWDVEITSNNKTIREGSVLQKKEKSEERDALNDMCTCAFSGRDDLLESNITKCLIN